MQTNACVLLAETDGQQEEEVGVVVKEEVTFVNMSRDNENSLKMHWNFLSEKVKWSFINDVRVCEDSNSVSEGINSWASVVTVDKNQLKRIVIIFNLFPYNIFYGSC